MLKNNNFCLKLTKPIKKLKKTMIFYTLSFIYFLYYYKKKKKQQVEHRRNQHKCAFPTIIEFRLFVIIINKDLTC